MDPEEVQQSGYYPGARWRVFPDETRTLYTPGKLHLATVEAWAQWTPCRTPFYESTPGGSGASVPLYDDVPVDADEEALAAVRLRFGADVPEEEDRHRSRARYLSHHERQHAHTHLYTRGALQGIAQEDVVFVLGDPSVRKALGNPTAPPPLPRHLASVRPVFDTVFRDAVGAASYVQELVARLFPARRTSGAERHLAVAVEYLVGTGAVCVAPDVLRAVATRAFAVADPATQNALDTVVEASARVLYHLDYRPQDLIVVRPALSAPERHTSSSADVVALVTRERFPAFPNVYLHRTFLQYGPPREPVWY